MKNQAPIKRPSPVVVANAGDAPLMDELVAKRVSEKTAGIRADAARAMFVNKNMGDLPETYRAQMPPSEDQSVLAAAEQKIRSAYREDFRTHMPFHVGYSNVIGVPATNGPPINDTRMQLGRAQALAEQARANGQPPETPVKAETPPPDLNAMTSGQLMAFGLKQQEAANKPGSTPAAAYGNTARPSKLQTIAPNYKGMSSASLISMGLRVLR